MIDIYVTGGNRKEKEFVEKVAFWCVKKLLPRVRNLEICIEIKNLKDRYADVMMADSRSDYLMRLQRGLPLFELVSTICHEMVHIKQYYRKEMDDFGRRWKSRKISDNTLYNDLPWEKQAFKMEHKLALECIQQLNYTIK